MKVACQERQILRNTPVVNRIYIFLIAFWVIVFDQLSKQAISKQLLFGQKVNLIDNLISFTKIYNTGAAFSILQKNTLLLILFSLFVTIAITYYFTKRVKLLPPMLALAWGLILGGTVGNLIDRITFGYVIDFIRLDFINFPIFNLADISINLGAILIVLHAFFKVPTSFFPKNKDS